MFIQPKVTRTSADGLSEIVYVYWLQDILVLELDGLYHYSRPTTRHKFKLEKKWTRLMQRENNMERYEPAQSVKEEILKQVQDSIRFSMV